MIFNWNNWYIDLIKYRVFDVYFFELRNMILDFIFLFVIKFVNFLYWYLYRINLIKL